MTGPRQLPRPFIAEAYGNRSRAEVLAASQRALNCPRYGECLGAAAHANWQGFDCVSCDFYHSREPAEVVVLTLPPRLEKGWCQGDGRTPCPVGASLCRVGGVGQPPKRCPACERAARLRRRRERDHLRRAGASATAGES